MDFKITFFGKEGMASAVASPGESFHGVVHLMKDADMDILDEIEISYDRTLGTCKYYDGETAQCVAYVVNQEKFESLSAGGLVENHSPSERYMDIMIEGAQIFGVAEEYI